MTEQAKRVTRRMRRKDLDHKIMHWAGDDWCGNDVPPASTLRWKIYYDDTDDSGEYRVYSVDNDGFDLWIGYANEWKWHMSRKEALKLAWFILWTWRGKGEWFGFKRWAYYKALHRSCDKHRKWMTSGEN